MNVIEIYGDGNVILTLEQDVAGGSVDTSVVVQLAGNRADIQLPPDFPVVDPRLLANIGGGRYRLKPWREIQSTSDSLIRRELQTLLDNLLLRLRSLDVTANAGSFFGASGIGSMAGFASIRLCVVLPNIDPSAEPGAVLLTATAEAMVDATVFNEQVNARGRLGITIDLTRAVDRLAEASLSFLSDTLDSLDLTLPSWSLPTLRLVDIDLPSAKALRLIRFAVLPSRLTIAWNADPTVSLKIVGGALTVRMNPASGVLRFDGTNVLSMTDVSIQVDAAGLKFDGKLSTQVSTSVRLDALTLDRLPGPYSVVVEVLTITPNVTVQGPVGGPYVLTISTDLVFKRLAIAAKDEPTSRLVMDLACTVIWTGPGAPSVTLTNAHLWEPSSIKVELPTPSMSLPDILQFSLALPTLNVPDVDFERVVECIGRLLAAAARWVARQAGAAAAALAGLAEQVVALISQLMARIRDALSGVAGALGGLVIEVRVDPGTFKLKQVALGPALSAAAGAKSVSAKLLGFHVAIPFELRPSLIIDFDEGWAAVAVGSTTAGAALTLSTDLWLKQGNATEHAPDEMATGGPPPEPLIKVSATPKVDVALVPMAVISGRPVFFRKMKLDGGDASLIEYPLASGAVAVLAGARQLEALVSNDFDIDVAFAADAKDRLLPFLKKPSDSTGAGVPFAQNIQVEKLGKAVVQAGIASLDIAVTIRVDDIQAKAILALSLDLSTLDARLGGDEIVVRGKTVEQSLCGMTARILPKAGSAAPPEFDQFVLDFADGNPKLRLHKDAFIELSYAKLAQSGRGLVFRGDAFVVSREGLDLSARIDNERPVQLAGVGTAFHFKSGTMEIRRGRLQGFSLLGTGPLPPALIGDANATVRIAFGDDGNNRLRVESASGELEKKGAPLVCEGTRFRFTINALGFEFIERDGYHFYFTLTGSAEFRPREGELSSGILQHLRNAKLILNKAPLAGDGRALARAISFQVPIQPPFRTSVFDLFTFELRGIGFHPMSPAFGDSPAVSLSGQINFAEIGDIPSPKFDFHQLWIAPPDDKGGSLPRVRCDGLTVGLSIGSALRIRGTAIAVDDKLPSMFKPDVLPANVTARGFLASGEIGIAGWADMSASMGFLELRENDGPPRPAFFLYGQFNKLSQPIPTPIGEFYLREVGFGLGFRYTLAGLQQADTVETPRQLVQVLDEVSKYQGSLDDVRAWLPEWRGDRLTLAMRALLTYRTASSPGKYNAKAEEAPGEKGPANPVLFDVIAALRSDLTFLVSVRAWLCVNYGDWIKDKGAAWQSQPGLRGYMYISVPRRQFLARMIADPEGHVGIHPKLPAPLIKAIKSTRWSSTLYIDESVFHQEFGWPYELGFELKEENFLLVAEGGTILRIADGALLYGIAFRARGYARFSGQVGGRSLGASVEARADFAIGAKLIALLSARDTSESFFYGAIQIDVALIFRVRVWLAFKIFRHEIRLEASFALELAISVAAELVLSPSEIGAKMTASIAVCAFGRTLRLGVGLSFNNDHLARTRVRVERYMQLGLGAQYPDPERGAPAPLPDRDRERSTTTGDERISRVAERQEVLAGQGEPPVADDDLPVVGRPLTEAAYWALLFKTSPASDGTERFVLQLMPRDHSPGHAVGAARIEAEHSTFYAAPRLRMVGDSIDVDDTNFDHRLVFQKPSLVAALEPLITGRPPNVGASELETYVNWRRVVAEGGTGGPGDTLQLWQLSQACFLDLDAHGALTEPDVMSYDTDRLPEDTQLRAQMLADASRERGQLRATLAREASIAERRSGVLGAVGETASMLAGQGAVLPFPGVDARDFGLTFLVAATDINRLFDGSHAARFQVFATGATGAAQGNVHLLNPPERMFATSAPRLAGATQRFTEGGVMLNWDLEPTWGASGDAASDPEFHLKHYRIERRFIGLGDDAPRPRCTTVKAAAPVVAATSTAIGSAPSWTILRPDHQYLDDLSDLAPAAREALLATTSDKRGAEAYAAWALAFPTVDEVRLVYTVVPIDIAGTAGPALPIVVDVHRPINRTRAVTRANLRFAYPSLPSLTDAIRPVLSLVIEDEVPLGEKSPRDLGLLQVRVASERTIAAGIYGVDAVTEALARPATPGADAPPGANERDFDLKRRGGTAHARDVTVVLRRRRVPALSGGPEFDEKAEPYAFVDANGYEALMRELGVDEQPAVRASRLYVRPQPAANARPAPWVCADLVVVIGGRNPAKEARLEASVECFEHPVDAEFSALDYEDLDIDAGRLLAMYPTPDAQISSQGEFNSVLRRDGERRVATRLRWNARPRSTRAGGSLHPELKALVGAFDLYSIDVASLSVDADPAEHARYHGRVQLLPRHLAALEPSETGDFAKVEAFYPSETVRLGGTNPTSPHKPTGGRRHPWFALDESTLCWPRTVLRRSLLTLPEEGTIASLFANGRPWGLRFSLQPADANSQPTSAWKAGSFELALCNMPKGTPTLAPSGGSWEYVHGQALSPAFLRNLLSHLVWRSTDGAADRAYSRDGTFPAATLRIDALGEKVGSTTPVLTNASVPVDATSSLHAILADFVDLIRFDRSGKFRRYELVMETPVAKAAAFDAFLDETPPSRDPYGWSALRGLGLAIGLRVFDTRTGAYLHAQEATSLAQNVLTDVLKRYASIEDAAGAPFIEVIGRPGDRFKLAAFDGGTPLTSQLSPVTDGLALFQVSLRPIADRLSVTARTKGVWPVRYAALVLTASSDELVVDASVLMDKALIVEAQEIMRDPAVGVTHLLWNSKAATLVDQPSAAAPWRIDVQGVKSETCVALLRITSWNEDGALPNEIVAQNGKLVPIDLPGVLRAGKKSKNSRVRDPFERFGALPPRWRAALTVMLRDVPPVPTLASRFEDFEARVRSRFAPPEPSTEEDTVKLHAKIATWSERFLHHGLGVEQKTGTVISAAMASIPQPAPWRLAPDEEGVVQVLIPESDRFGHLRHFAVRPVCRYDNFASAVNQKGGVPSLHGALDGRLGSQFADAVVARTEPVAAPLVVSARRVGDTKGSPGRLLELVIARHGEEQLTDCNRPVEAGLGFREIGVGFWREFAGARFARAVNPNVDLRHAFGPYVDALHPIAPPSGDFEQPMDEAALIELHDRLPDLWRGTQVLRLAALPYCFRVHALLYAAAGTVVSPATPATFVEGYYEFHRPWEHWNGAPGPGPAYRPLTSSPRWSVGSCTDHVLLTLHIPLVRIVDCMDEPACELWLGGATVPPLFYLPDTTTNYRVSLEAGGLTLEPEVEIAPLTTMDAGAAPYRVQATGRRFSLSGAEPRPVEQPSGKAWSLDIQVKVSGSQVAISPRFAPAANLLAEILKASILTDMPPEQWEAWLEAAPQASHQLSIRRPAPGTPWTDLQMQADAAHTVWRDFKHSDAVRVALDALARAGAINSDEAWIEFAEGAAEKVVQLPTLPTGLPALLAPLITLTRVSSWGWPSPLRGGYRHRRALAHVLPVADQRDFMRLLRAAFGEDRSYSRGRFAGGFREVRAPVPFDGLTVDVTEWIRVEAVKSGWQTALRVLLRLQWTRAAVLPADALDQAYQALEGLAGVDDALQLLDDIADDLSPVERALDVPHEHRKQVMQALAPLGQIILGHRLTIALPTPPSEGFLTAMAKIHGGDTLLPQVLALAQDQLFGPGRQPVVTAYKGLLPPIDTTMARDPRSTP